MKHEDIDLTKVQKKFRVRTRKLHERSLSTKHEVYREITLIALPGSHNDSIELFQLHDDDAKYHNEMLSRIHYRREMKVQ